MKTPMKPKAPKLNRTVANRELMNATKVAIGCEMVKADGSVCGYNEHPQALQFDHIDPSTKFRNKNGRLRSPSDMVYYSQADVIAEMNKCRVLCANCHMIYTHTVQRKPDLEMSVAPVRLVA